MYLRSGWVLVLAMKFRFAHMSDCHLGAWNAHPELRELPPLAFAKAIDKCVAERVDFIIIAGDLFDTSFPPVDILAACAATLRKARDAGIRIYYVAGSHDYSPTGKSMLSVLEEAGLMMNVAKGSEADGKLLLEATRDATGAALYGILGRRGSLDAGYFEALDRRIEAAGGFKIFVMHCGIAEYKPERFADMAAVPLSALPKNFAYYASGHVHVPFVDRERNIAFPGPLFPAGMDELERGDSGFYIVECNGTESSAHSTEAGGPASLIIRREPVKLKDVAVVKLAGEGKSAGRVEKELLEAVEAADVQGKIVLVKAKGTLSEGSAADIDWRLAAEKALEKGAFCVKFAKNLQSKEFEAMATGASLSTEQLEKKLVAEHSSQLALGSADVIQLVPRLMAALAEEKKEGESNAAYEERIRRAAKRVMELGE